jgi:phosphate transport system substrate-binding protein
MRGLPSILPPWIDETDVNAIATTQGRPPALQLSGSTTLLPRMQRAAESYMRVQMFSDAARIVINGGCGTARGYKALLDGTTDIAMASGAVPADLAAAAAARGLAFRAAIVSRDAILPLVHAANPLDSLTLLQLRNIFTGRIVNWRGVGGPDAAIEVLVGPASGGVSASWHKTLLGDGDTCTPLARVLGMDERLARLAKRPDAITYLAQMALPLRGLKVLRVGGIAAAPMPSAYPLHAPMSLVTLGMPGPAAARFIAHAAATARADGAVELRHE